MKNFIVYLQEAIKMDSSFYEFAAKITRLGNRGVKKAQEENRRLGLPNVYAIEGKPVFVMPNGEIRTEMP